MVAYLIQLAKQLIGYCEQGVIGRAHIPDYIRALDKELDRLDPRDFLPAVRAEFVMFQLDLRKYVGLELSGNEDQIRILTVRIKDIVQRIVGVLDQYGGEGSRAVSRSFAFVKDADLRQIVERDYRELRLQVFPSDAWKSTVILGGSILEAILFDQLATDPAMLKLAIASKNAPKDKAGNVKDLFAGDWTLQNLIDVSVGLNILPADRAKTFDQVLRDYRNFVHPKKELRSHHPCTEAEAMMSIGALEGVCNILQGAK